MTANFDRWEADPFFSAAEDVQDSADRLESAYRSWVSVRSVTDTDPSCGDNLGNSVDILRRDPSCGDNLGNSVDILRRELQTALGTAKWQLDEFERAVKSSYLGRDVDASGRHKQFVMAIQSQISGIEKAMSDSVIDEGKKRLRWVQLDDHEKDDLALFLCGSCENNSNSLEQQSVNKTEEMVDLRIDDAHMLNRRDLRDFCNVGSDCGPGVNGYKETILINKDSKFVVQLAEQNVADSHDDWHTGATIDRKSGHRGSSSDGAVLGSWKIVIADENDEKETVESQSKESLARLNLWDLTNKLGLAAKLKWSKSGLKRWKDSGHCHPGNEYIRDLGMKTWLRGNKKMTNGECVSYDNILSHKLTYGWAGSLQRKMQRSQYCIQYSRPLQITWMLLIILCLVGLFTFHVI